MVEVKVTCDRCKKQIKDPMEDPFFHVTIREKCFKPDGSIYTIDQYDMTLCDECEAMLHEGKEKEKTEAAVPEKKPAKEKPEAAVPEKPKAAVEEVAPVQLTGGGEKEESGSDSRESSPEERVESD